MIEDKQLKRWMLGGAHFKVIRESKGLPWQLREGNKLFKDGDMVHAVMFGDDLYVSPDLYNLINDITANAQEDNAQLHIDLEYWKNKCDKH